MGAETATVLLHRNKRKNKQKTTQSVELTASFFNRLVFTVLFKFKFVKSFKSLSRQFHTFVPTSRILNFPWFVLN